MNYSKAVKVYTFEIPANGAFPLLVQSDYFRLQSATGAVDVAGDTFGTLPDLLTGQGLENTPYKRLVFTDKTGAPNTVSVLCSGDLFIDNRTYGVVTVSGAISLDAASLSGITTPHESTGSDVSNADTVANTAITLFTPAANANGAILISAHGEGLNPGLVSSGFIAKTSAPANQADGEIILTLETTGLNGANWVYSGRIHIPQKIAAGKGLYFISNGALVGGYRAARWKLL